MSSNLETVPRIGMPPDAPAPSPAEHASGADASARGALLWVGVATLVGAALRALAARPGGMWRDETQFLWIVVAPSWGEMLSFIRHDEAHPPLFFALTRLWFAAFGASELAALVLVALLGVAAIPVTYLCGAALGGRRAGVIAATLVAVLPVLVDLSGFVRPYSLLPLLCLVSVSLLARALHTDRWRYWAGWAAATVALALTHNWAMLVLLGEAACAAVVLVVRPRWATASWRRALSAGALAAVGFLPWLPTFVDQVSRSGHPPAGALWPPSVLLYPVFEDPAYGAHLLLLALGASVAVMVVRRRVAPHELGAAILLLGVPAVALLAAFALSGRTNVVFVRCLATVVPCLLVALALWLDRLPRAMMPPVALLLVCWPLADFARRLRYEPRMHSNAAAVAAAVDQSATPGDLLAVSQYWLASSVNWYLRTPMEQYAYPALHRVTAASFADVGARVRNPATARDYYAALDRTHAERRRVWLVRIAPRTSEAVLRRIVTADPERQDSLMAALMPWEMDDLLAYRQWHRLARRYGAPSRQPLTVPAGRVETLVLERFDPPPAAAIVEGSWPP